MPNENNRIEQLENKFRSLNERVKKLESRFLTKPKETPISNTNFSGATGGIRFLISKRLIGKNTLAEVMNLLSENNYHYSTQAVHIALSRLSKTAGPLVSLKVGGKKVYAERK